MKLKPKNWDKFQHYKDRSPPWIKLHRDLLDNRNYWNLSPVAAKYLPLIWLISSEKDGVIPDNDDLAFRLRIGVPEAKEIVEELTTSQFLIGISDEEVEQAATNAQSLAAQNGYGSRHISDKIKRLVWDRDAGKCQDCGAVKNIEYDHIMPVSKGGGSNIENIQLLCRPCNRKKRAKTAEHGATQNLSSRILERETERETEGEAKQKTQSRGTRLPADWVPSEAQIAYCRTERPDLRPEWVAANFRDFWISKAGSTAVKLDWDATWRNWVRKEREQPSPKNFGTKQLTMQEEMALRARARQ